MNPQLDEDAINLQDLQAQIDLSMSFAQNLATSWVKATHYSQSSRQCDLEKEIKEYVRRPARLGVGAPIPESQSLAREAAGLKFKLEGEKNRQRGDEASDVKKNQSDDEEESRSGAIKKRARVNPSDALPRKEKRGNRDNGKLGPAVHPAAMKGIPFDRPPLTSVRDSVEVCGAAKELLLVPDTPQSRNDKERKQPLQSDIQSHNKGPRMKRMDLLNVKFHPSPQILTSLRPSQNPRLSNPSASLFHAQTPTTTLVSHQSALDISLAAHPLLSPVDRTAALNFLKQPLLNLRGPPSEPGSEEDELVGPLGLSPKKKRKRRKKKKTQMNTTKRLSS